MLGTALTVRTAPGVNLLVHAALDVAQPGDVLVVDGGGDLSRAIAGELMAARALILGVQGFVIHGAVRDAAGFRRRAFPVYARGTTPAGPYKESPGEVNVAIGCGGVVVHPGDIVVGDEDGVAMVPRGPAVEVARAQHENKGRRMDGRQTQPEG